MNNIFIKTKLLILVIFCFIIAEPTTAQNPTPNNEIVISWQAQSFIPFNFGGKTMPTVGSTIFASFDFIKNQKIVDLSKNNVYWYINNELFARGVGLQTINFIAPAPAGSAIDLRIELPEFGVSKTIEIPIVKPKIVIDTPFPKKEIKTNYFEIVAIPYFFNLPNNNLDYLSINWFINGERAVSSFEDLLKLKVNIKTEEQQNINIKTIVSNSLNQFESANKNVDLLFRK